MLRPCMGLDHAHSDCSQAATSYHHCAESRPASCSHWRSHKRCTVVSAFAIEAPTRHEKMIHARKARFPHDFCTRGTCLHQKRCASFLEQFHQPRTTCAVAQRSATKPLYATFARQQQLCNFIGRGDCKIARSSHQWYRGDQSCRGQQQQRPLRAAVCSSASSSTIEREAVGGRQRKSWPRQLL